MNFQDLLSKIKSLDEAAPMVPPNDDGGVENIADVDFAECGDMNPKAVLPGGDDDMLTSECGGMMSSMSAPKQSDSVTMNVSMNGSGAGGIKDLLDILRNIESSGDQDSDDVIVGMEAEEDFSDATTRPNPQHIAVPDSGDDLHREKDSYRAVAGGDNPMRVRESLVSKLASKYAEIKGQ